MGGTCHPWVASAPEEEISDSGGLGGTHRPGIAARVDPSGRAVDSGPTLVGAHPTPSLRARLEPRRGHGGVVKSKSIHRINLCHRFLPSNQPSNQPYESTFLTANHPRINLCHCFFCSNHPNQPLISPESTYVTSPYHPLVSPESTYVIAPYHPYQPHVSTESTFVISAYHPYQPYHPSNQPMSLHCI